MKTNLTRTITFKSYNAKGLVVSTHTADIHFEELNGNTFWHVGNIDGQPYSLSKLTPRDYKHYQKVAKNVYLRLEREEAGIVVH